MKRIARTPETFEALNLFTAVGLKEGYRVDNEAHQRQFITAIENSLKAAHGNLRILYGKRIEALFAHVAGALGQCLMVKVEDSGDIFTADGDVKAPDYRLTLRDRRQMLIEVKNCHADGLDRPFSLKRSYFEQLDRYADINSTPLKIAIFFSRWNRWCLLSRHSFEEKGDSLITGVMNAMAKNEMSAIGDVSLATLPELRLELLANPTEAKEIDDDGQAQIIFRSSRLFCRGMEIIEPAEKEIAFRLMRYGDWPDTSEAIVENGKLLGMVITATPRETHEGQDLEVIGNLSSMVSAAFAEMTVADRRPVALDVAVDPSAFALYIPEGFKSDVFPLLRIVQKPNFEYEAREQ
ncbi:hypothetical protein HDG34_003907 [Paraburkholderia sp. HC6.4b]|uniref:PD-(D/E)XK nuclease superfamily protein n=1 Tax=Paraburkholderia podalyriae TaxID=1938811 RepID=A0ABR7PFQ0_9BURK|nr:MULTISPECIES: hypothetical protein [Paraburkholderia]MBB5409954.1 hypothetical protein [Paraburkholderia sp. HC6.4b]MBB5452131.1 hypothetical protein [Paraburkholderia sp. Kb1A]MBC8745205.1 hypothetical protein [Paraburkholderia podalyriae]